MVIATDSGYETIADLSSVQGAKVSLPAQTQRRAGTPLGVVSASNAAAAAPTIAASTSTMSSPSFAAALQMRPQMVVRFVSKLKCSSFLHALSASRHRFL